MITAKYIASEEHLMQGVARHLDRLQKKTVWRAIAALGYFLIAGSLMLAYDCVRRYDDIRALAPQALLIVAFLLICGATMAWSRFIGMYVTRRAVRKMPTLNTGVTCAFSEDGLSMAGSGFDSRQEWRTLAGAVIFPDGLLLYPNKATVHWIPVTAFDSASGFAVAVDLVVRNVQGCKDLR